jgi:hypothetical protein
MGTYVHPHSSLGSPIPEPQPDNKGLEKRKAQIQLRLKQPVFNH